MASKTRRLLCLAIVLWPAPAGAQPLFRYEHDWTVTIGERTFGLREVVQTPGEFRWTQVWLGRRSFDVRFRAATIAALILVPLLVAILACCFLIRRVRIAHSPSR